MPCPASPKHERFTHLNGGPIQANRNAVQHQSPKVAQRTLGICATARTNTPKGFASEPGVVWNPVRGTRRSCGL